jgi:hypothetical protein
LKYFFKNVVTAWKTATAPKHTEKQPPQNTMKGLFAAAERLSALKTAND